MNYNAYEILGLTADATRDQVTERYNQLRQQYQKDRFLPGDAGEEASEKLQQIEVAYRDILFALDEADRIAAGDANAANGTNDASASGDQPRHEDYSDVEQLISQDKLDEAQKLLDERTHRDAEWHYMQSIVFYKRNWFLESKKQLEMACNMEPNNKRYKQSLEKLTKILASNTISPDQMRTNNGSANQGEQRNVGAGNGTCTGSACMDCLLCNACCNCASCMGGM